MLLQTAICFFVFPYHLVHARNIQVITTMPYNFTVDVASTAAAFELAAETSMNVYGSDLNISMKYLFNQSHRNCDDVSSQNVQMLAEYYFKNKDQFDCFAVVTIGCGDQTGIASLSRAFDLLLFSNALTNNDFVNVKIGSPTATALMGTYAGYGQVVLEILSYHTWYHATILSEVKAISPFYKALRDQILESVKQSRQPFVLDSYLVDISSNLTIRTALRFSKQRSRVIILLTIGSTAVKILQTADKENMTNGEYVFFNVQPSQLESYGKISQFAYGFNDKAQIAFRSLFFITYRSVRDNVNSLNPEIAERSRSGYNITIYDHGDQPLDFPPVRSSYDIVELFGKVVNESFAEEDAKKGICSGLDLIKRMTNRTFSLATGDTYINSGRVRQLDLDIFGYNTSTMTLQITGFYSWSKKQLIWSKTRSVNWPTKDGTPPPDIPLCGFSEEEGLCATKSTYSIVDIIVPITMCGLLLYAIVFAASQWTQMKRLPENWWLLVYDDLRRASSRRYRSGRHASTRELSQSLN